MIDTLSPSDLDAAKRLMAKVDFSTTGCWLSRAAKNKPNGYAQITRSGKYGLAHRFSYELFVGPVTKGLQLDHLCKVKHCVNPEHLEAVTASTNVRRSDSCCARNARVTHCPHGHAYDEENTYMNGGKRFCRTCGRNRKKR